MTGRSSARAASYGRPRKGFALILVLALVALTLGFSYSLMRMNTVDHELQRNQSRKSDARSAAQAGIAVALRKLYDGSWSGADSNFVGNLDASGLEGFTVTYSTGDSSLNTSSANWAEYPFRLTIDSKGYSIDPTAASSRSEYTIRVVAQLIRKKLNTNTVLVTGLESFSISQSADSPVRIHHPIRINDNFHLQGELRFSREYPQSLLGLPYTAFFQDIQKMYEDRGWDYRPFSGRLYTPSSRQPNTGDVVRVLDAMLKVPRTDVPISSTPLVPVTTSFNGYQLYAKGKTYPGTTLPLRADTLDEVPDAQYVIQSGSYAASPDTNPLGVFTCSQASVGFTSNTSFQGFVINCTAGSSADIHIGGQNVALRAQVLPDLSGDTTNYRLPVVMSCDDVRIHNGGNRNIEGWIVCGDEFQLKPGASSSTITVTGGVFCRELYLDERTSWVRTLLDWDTAHTGWTLDLTKSGMNVYFPGWLFNNRSSWGIYLTPRLIFSATPNGVKNHVPDMGQPIYTADPADGGLAWDVVRWQELGAL